MLSFVTRCILIFILLLTITLQAQTFNVRKSIRGYETGMTISLDVYQSYINSYFHLRHKSSTPIFHPRDESTIYRWLFAQLLKPRYLIFQATAYPLATISSQLETFHPHQFDQFEFMGINLLRTIGSGPEEPYALSLLIGNLAFLGYRERIDNKIKQSGSALAGFIVTTGHWHIYDNIRINDRWWQIEFILTGLLKEPDMKKISWNFRFGTKIHSNKLVPDVAIISLQRNHTKWQHHGFSLLKNSVLQYEAHFPIGHQWKGSPFTIRQLVSYGKKLPIKIFGRFIVLRLGGGVLWEWVRLYDHEKRQFGPKEKTQLVWLIQPNVEF